MKAVKSAAWLALASASAALVAGVRFNWMAYALLMSGLIVLVMLLEFEERNRDPRRIALAAVLVALSVSSRQLIHGIEFSPVFTIVILSGSAFGFTTGFAVGALTMFLSNFFIGHGPWTPFQMLGMGLTGAAACIIPKGGRWGVRVLAAYSVVTAYLYGSLTDLFSWLVFVPTHTFDSFLAVRAAGMLADTTRAIGNVFFMAVFAPTLLRILGRFKKRLQ
jgi:energy-coupling factor transport system substrate-specific component